MYSGKKKYLLYIVVITLIFCISCGTQKRYEVLSFFFDGVPNPNISNVNTTLDSISVPDSSSLLASLDKIVKPIAILHSPYQKKECIACHNKKSISKTIESQPALCYRCHNNYKEISNFVHGPVGGGYCTFCHEPHKAQLEKLLSKPAQQLCLHCHDSVTVFNNKFHKNRAETTCMKCHNPHCGENRFMPQHGSCYNCHNDFKKVYTFLHGPVAGEYCTSCHSAHIENTSNLLLKDGNQLCMNCHDAKLINKREYHTNNEAICTACHNPHGGKNKFFTKLN